MAPRLDASPCIRSPSAGTRCPCQPDQCCRCFFFGASLPTSYFFRRYSLSFRVLGLRGFFLFAMSLVAGSVPTWLGERRRGDEDGGREPKASSRAGKGGLLVSPGPSWPTPLDRAACTKNIKVFETAPANVKKILLYKDI
eukprot:scaffold309611_cov36-Tisochrysis_lutea.AAC.1